MRLPYPKDLSARVYLEHHGFMFGGRAEVFPPRSDLSHAERVALSALMLKGWVVRPLKRGRIIIDRLVGYLPSQRVITTDSSGNLRHAVRVDFGFEGEITVPL